MLKKLCSWFKRKPVFVSVRSEDHYDEDLIPAEKFATKMHKVYQGSGRGEKYILVADPPLIDKDQRSAIMSISAQSYADMGNIIANIVPKVKGAQKGDLIYSLRKSAFDEVTFHNGKKIVLSEFVIPFLLRWDGDRWATIFGSVQIPVNE